MKNDHLIIERAYIQCARCGEATRHDEGHVCVCNHQFFEIKKIDNTPTCTCENSLIHFHLPNKHGVLVMCALCNERRELWEDGSMNIINNK